MVHGREIDGKTDSFGVSGFVYKNVFLIYDKRTQSLWYPLDDEKWTAISGPRKGETIPFIAEPPPVSLGEWRKKHPNTKVLLGSRAHLERKGE
ncbi:MAG: DUF3179 domain-containing protein [Planctomycetes bacterium]|nr:DUF3179 domain-containing protein [Planctomycetota bacterium]